ncbi:MAG TPA: hypothetical protein PL187_11280, partial [Caldilinea sp.]|nr:hypothetical protein [Caldilinea sp.]
ECATVRPQRQALEIVLAALAVSLGLLTAGVSLAASQRPVAAAGFLLALVFFQMSTISHGSHDEHH